MTTEQRRIYTNAYEAAIAALDAACEFRVHRTKENARKSEAANLAVGEAAQAASIAKSSLEYCEAYERLEEAACCAELVWLTLTQKYCTRMTRKDFREWADKIRRNMAEADSSQINDG